MAAGRPMKQPDGKIVAVNGGGPANLVAARYLSR
jgi:NADPH-dependent glutamate synthase beta subunit-like oxidoreductase